MDALRELDADGNAVGTSGSIKHSINTFVSLDLFFAVSEQINSLTVHYSFESLSRPLHI